LRRRQPANSSSDQYADSSAYDKRPNHHGESDQPANTATNKCTNFSFTHNFESNIGANYGTTHYFISNWFSIPCSGI
jgi:hypothetical protein